MRYFCHTSSGNGQIKNAKKKKKDIDNLNSTISRLDICTPECVVVYILGTYMYVYRDRITGRGEKEIEGKRKFCS